MYWRHSTIKQNVKFFFSELNQCQLRSGRTACYAIDQRPFCISAQDWQAIVDMCLILYKHYKLCIYNFEMDVQQSNANPSDNQVEQQVEAEDDEANLNTKGKYIQKQQQLPKQFNKAKRTMTKMVNQYFMHLKQQLLSGNGKFIYAREHIPAVQSAITKLATIRYTDLKSLQPKKSQIMDDFLLSYVAESKKIIKYNLNIYNNNQQKPKVLQLQNAQHFQLPDQATPAAFGANAYLFDGSKFDFERMVYVPMQVNYKINLITGQICVLQAKPPVYRMKCCVIKIKRGFMILGGYVGLTKILTKKCIFYSIQNASFHEMASLNLLHNCPSGCVHNQKIYLFSQAGIQIFNQNQNKWTAIEIPRRLRCLPFQYCVSVSQNQIMIIGGKMCNQNSSDLRIYNTENNRIDQYSDIIPVGVSSQRSWGPMIINNFVTVMSNIQASTFPQVAIKRDAVQIVLIGLGGCFLNTLIAQS